MEQSRDQNETTSAKQEWLSLLFVLAILVPLLTVAIVGGYGFVVWMLQAFVFGPPGTGG